MKSTVNKLENSRVEIVVDFEKDVWVAAQDKAFKKLASELEIKGFRKGKVPADIARSHIEAGKIMMTAVEALVQPTFEAVLDEHKLVPMARPSYDIPKLSDSELQIKFIIIVAPEVKLGQYKGLTIGHNAVSVSDEDVDLKLISLREQNAELVLKEDVATYGDTAVIDFEGFVDGVAFEGGKAENHSLELGSGQFIPGFEEQVVGHKAGDNFDVNVTFPAQYVESLAGKDATFKVVVHEVKTKQIPELSDDFAADLNLEGVKNLTDLRAHTVKELKVSKENDEKNRYLDALLKAIRDASTVEVAEEIVHDEAHNMEHQLEQQISQSGLSLDEYANMTGTTHEALHAKFHDDARRNIINFLLLEEIAKVEDLTVSEAMVDFEVAKIAQQYNMEEAKVREILGENIKRLESDIKQKQIFDFLLENNQ